MSLNKTRRRKIVIISYYWPPMHAIGGLRLYYLARELASRGLEVETITAARSAYDPENTYDFPELSGVKLHYVEYSSRLQSNVGLYCPDLLRRLRPIRKCAVSLGAERLDPRDLWIKKAVEVGKKVSDKNTILLSSSGPFSCHEIGARIKNEGECHEWVADYRDLYIDDPLERHGQIARFARKFREEKALKDVSRVSTVSIGYSNQLSKRLGKPCSVFYNGYTEDRISTSVPTRNNQTMRIVHAGMIYKSCNWLRSVDDALVIANKMRSGESYVGEVWGSQLSDYECRSFKQILPMGQTCYSKSLEIMRDADFLLLMLPLENNGSIPAKVFEYIATGRMIIAVGGQEDDEVIGILERTARFKRFNAFDVNGLGSFLTNSFSGREVDVNVKSHKKEDVMKFSREYQSRCWADWLLGAT